MLYTTHLIILASKSCHAHIIECWNPSFEIQYFKHEELVGANPVKVMVSGTHVRGCFIKPL